MTKKLYRSPDKSICGVCAGLADYLNVDVTIIRMIVVAISIITAIVPAFVIYLIAAFIIPNGNTTDYYQMYNNTSKKLTKGADKRIAGICGGISEYLDIDPTFVRLGYLLLAFFFGYGIIFYIACIFFFPPNPNFPNNQQPVNPPYPPQDQNGSNFNN